MLMYKLGGVEAILYTVPSDGKDKKKKKKQLEGGRLVWN